MLVLVAVDDPGLRQTITQAIETEHQKFAVARSASQLFDNLESHNPNIVLLDAWLPDTDTRSVICSIQKSAPSSKIIFMSRREDPASIRDALNWGASNYIELNRSDDYVKLQLRCLLSETHLDLTQVSPQQEISTAENQAALVPKGFFNENPKLLVQTQQRFEKAIENSIPVIIEGAAGTGKATLGRFLLNKGFPQCPGYEFSAESESIQSLDKHIIQCVDQHWFLVRRIENATVEMQDAILALIKAGHHVVATTRGRLMDHVIDNRIGHELYSKLNSAPIWADKIEDRPQDLHYIAQCFLKEATGLMQVRVSNENQLLMRIMDQKIANGYWGLRQIVFYELLTQQSQDEALSLQKEDFARAAELKKHQRSPLSSGADFATVKLLDNAGKVRPLAEIEEDTVRFALDHLDGRLGKVAKALGLGRTTLYRKMTQLAGIQPLLQSKPQKPATDQYQPDTHINNEIQPAGTSASRSSKTPAKAA